MNRRTFCKAAVGTTLAAGHALRAGEPAASPWRLGCYTRPFDQHDYRVALDAIAEAGYEYAGILSHKGKTWLVITIDTTPAEAAQVGEEVRKRGLRTLSVYADFPVQDAADRTSQGLRRLIEHARACGSPDLLLGGTSYEAQYDAYYRAIADCCDFAADQGVRLTIKPHGGSNATGQQCRKAIERVGHPNFRLWYDPGNIFYYSDGKRDPVEDAATVDGLVVGMSVKDFRDPKEVLLTPGTGRVRFDAVLQKLRAGGFRGGPLVVECLTPGGRAEVTAEARKALDLLKRLTATA